MARPRKHPEGTGPAQAPSRKDKEPITVWLNEDVAHRITRIASTFRTSKQSIYDLATALLLDHIRRSLDIEPTDNELERKERDILRADCAKALSQLELDAQISWPLISDDAAVRIPSPISIPESVKKAAIDNLIESRKLTEKNWPRFFPNTPLPVLKLLRAKAAAAAVNPEDEAKWMAAELDRMKKIGGADMTDEEVALARDDAARRGL